MKATEANRPARIVAITLGSGESFNVGIWHPTAAELEANRAAKTEAERLAVRLGLVRWWRYRILNDDGTFTVIPFSRDVLDKLISDDPFVGEQLRGAVRQFFWGGLGGTYTRPADVVIPPVEEAPNTITAKPLGFRLRGSTLKPVYRINVHPLEEPPAEVSTMVPWIIRGVEFPEPLPAKSPTAGEHYVR